MRQRPNDGARVMVTDEKGNVLGESHADFRKMKNLARRPEIAAARAGQSNSKSVRYSQTLKTCPVLVVKLKEGDDAYQ